MSHDDRLYRLEAKVDYLYRHLGIDPEAVLLRAGDFSAQDEFGYSPQDEFSASPQAGFSSSPGGGLPPSPGDGLPSSFHDALRRGHLIEAIKIYRTATGAGLKEAKAAVDAMKRNYR
jgi:hypothetical protein